MRTFVLACGASIALLSVPSASAANLTCVDGNVGGSGWRQVATCNQNGNHFSCSISGSGPGQGFSYSASGEGKIAGQRGGGQSLNAKWTGKGFAGTYRDGQGKGWRINLSC